MHNAYSLLSIYDSTGQLISNVELPPSALWKGCGKADQRELFLSFTSFLHPSTIYHYDLHSMVLQPLGHAA